MNMHEFMNKHKKKVLSAISIMVVASMLLSLVASFILAF